MTHDEALLHIADFAAGRLHDAELRREVSGHFVDCSECQGIVALAQDVERLADAEGSSVLGEAPAIRAARRDWRPALIAAGLFVGLLAGWMLWKTRGGSSVPSMLAQSTVFPVESAVRGPADTDIIDVVLRSGDGLAPLVLPVPCAGPVTVSVEITRGGSAVWNAAPVSLSPVQGLAWLSVTLPSQVLEPGVYTLTVASRDGRELAARRFRVLRLR